MPGKKLEKVRSGIAGFDALAHGGIPKGRLTIVSGSTGTGKTLFCLQFLYMGASQFGENGVFVTFEERPDDLVKNLSSFGWDVEGLMKAKKFAIVDVTGPDPERDPVMRQLFEREWQSDGEVERIAGGSVLSRRLAGLARFLVESQGFPVFTELFVTDVHGRVVGFC